MAMMDNFAGSTPHEPWMKRNGGFVRFKQNSKVEGYTQKFSNIAGSSFSKTITFMQSLKQSKA